MVWLDLDVEAAPDTGTPSVKAHSSAVFLNEFGNSKLFELYLNFHHGTTRAAKTEQFTSITMVVPWYYLQMIWQIITKGKYGFSL